MKKISLIILSLLMIFILTSCKEESLTNEYYVVADYKRLEKYGLVLILSKIVKS